MIAGVQVDVQLAGLHALGVFVQLGAAGAAAHALHLRYLQQQALGQLPDLVGLGQRGARVEQ
jgi:hypothetical protein